MKDIFKILSLLSFVALMFIKVSGFHVYTHADNDTDSAIENCVSCELAIEQQQQGFTTPVLIGFQKVMVIEEVTPIVSKDQAFILQANPSDFFSRPPPTAV
ncbi:MAG: hypothetical protein HKP24_03595 [Croceitalea sp.]|nr:hypothetical protein [Croceitalea sp.]